MYSINVSHKSKRMTTLQLGMSNPSSATLSSAGEKSEIPCSNKKIQLSLTKLINDHDLLPVIHRNVSLHTMAHKHITRNIGQLQLFDKLVHRARSISLPNKHNPRSLRSSIHLVQQLDQFEHLGGKIISRKMRFDIEMSLVGDNFFHPFDFSFLFLFGLAKLN